MKKNLLLIGLLLNLTAIQAQNAPENRYAGIEIELTGVKFTILDFNTTTEKVDNLDYFAYNKVVYDANNTISGGFAENGIHNTVLKVEQFYKEAKVTYKLSDTQIFIAVSHGVVLQAMRKDNVTTTTKSASLQYLNTQILRRLPHYGKQIYFLDEHTEPELTHIGLIPQATRTKVALLDIGSGNTKGGYFADTSQKKFVPFEISEGTLSLSNLAKKDLAPNQFDCCYTSKVKETINSKLSEIRLSVAGIRSQSKLVLTGGIGWAVARITSPKDTKDLQRITLEDVNQVRSIVSNNETFRNLLAQSKLPENKELKRVLDVFNQDLLISGSMLLSQLLEEIKGNSNDYHFYVYTASYAGWLKGYIIASKEASNALSKVDSPKQPPINRYAGIEIGSTGVKFLVMDLKCEIDKTNHLSYFVYDKVEEAAENTNFIDFTEGASRMTVRAVEQFYNKAKNRYKLDDMNIYMYISSGVVFQCLQADTVTDMVKSVRLALLRKNILERLPSYNRIKNGCIGIGAGDEEAELAHIAIIPEKMRTEVALVDIGGGQMQGGYFVTEPKRVFIPFQINEGTQSLSNKVKKHLSLTDFDKTYVRSVQDTVNIGLKNEIQMIASQIRRKQDIVLTGGICWAVACIANPKDDKDMQRITRQEVNQVLNLVSDAQSFKKLVKQSKEPENKALKSVLDVFNQDLLISGSILLKKLLQEIERDTPDYHFYVYKASYSFILKGYLIASLSEEDSMYKCVCRSR